MTLINKKSSASIKALAFTMGVVCGIVIGIFTIQNFQCNQVWKSLKSLHSSYTYLSSISSQRNLIITAAVNSDLRSVYRFSRSARASCASCTLVMIVAKTAMNSKDFQELANLYSIVFISNEDYFPKKLNAYRSDVAYIYYARWIIIKNYLLTLQTKNIVFDNVFACDSLDGLFQRNIFDFMNNDTQSLYAFMEDVRMTIGTCRINSQWIKTCYGEIELNRISNRSIACAGTVLGAWSAFMSYLSVMEFEILHRSAACRATHGDQGLLNYIVHNEKIPNVTIHRISHEYGFVGTLGYAPWLKRNQFGLVENANGSVYAFIHQWNRSKQMIEQFQREYQLISADVRNKKD